MDTIKDFNQNINNSYDADKSFLLWKNYRQEISSFLSSQNLEDKSVLIIGSGHLNDLDLNIFKSSKHVSFLDVDIENTKLGYNRQNVSIAHSFIELDITNLSDTDFIKEFLEASIKLKEVVLEKYQTYHKPLNIKNYDFIILLPIYTQLLLPQLLPVIQSETLLNKLMIFIGYRIQILNQEIQNHLSLDATLVVLSDILEYKTISEEAVYIKAHQANPIILDEMIQNYLNAYGHSLGSFGLEDMSSQMRTLKENILYWPFNQDKILLVKGKIMKNR